MRIASVIGSYNSSGLTRKIYRELKAIPGHDVYVLENSDSKRRSFWCDDTIHMGYKNYGAGGLRDFIFSFIPFRKYDFVGFWNNDVSGVPKDYMEIMRKYMREDVGMLSSAINDTGTGWKHMRRESRSGAREVRHVEDIACYFNVKNFNKMCKYLPLPYWGVVDISMSAMYRQNGYMLVVVDDTMVTHDLSGARKVAGNIDEYLNKFPGELTEWLKKYPEIQKDYEEYIASNRNNS